MNPLERGRNILNRVRTGAEHAVDNVKHTVQNTAHQVAEGGRKVGQAVDAFEHKVEAKATTVKELFGKGSQPDRKYDGQFVGAGGQTFPPNTPLSSIPGVTPRNNPNPKETVVYVNGILTEKATQSYTLQEIADKTGAKAIGIHNSTEGAVADVIQCAKDKLDKGKNPAVDTLADTLYSELKAGRSVHVMAHSQGGLITSRALGDVARRLRIEDGLSQADVEKTMSKLNVETFGAAAMSYPDGPNYVHYVNTKDIVPGAFGLGDGKGLDEFLHHPGKGAVVHRFTESGSPVQAHSIDTTYLNHRVPFDQARAGKF
ncbi:hypothetical protein JGU66_04020 [Myxococcaceae bacterium JPH2]|nr:hypothetical protein [Myxococcaceae bacterium JPH2]